MMYKSFDAMMMKSIIIITLLCLVDSSGRIHPESRVFCLHESFNASCRANPAAKASPSGPNQPRHFVLIVSAVYGRMKLGRCINGDFNVGCSMDVTSYLDSQCSARESCDVSVRNLVDIHPCQRDFMSYLEASYVCIEAFSSKEADVCPADQKLLYMAVPSGKIVHESMFSHHVIGSEECPWGVRGQPGQKIQLKVVIIGDENTQPGNYDDHVICSELYVISDVIEGISTEVNVCSGKSRERTIYLSTSHEISFFVTRPRDSVVDDVSDDVIGADQSKESSQDGETSETRRRRRATMKFVITFEAVGCPDLTVPYGATMRKTQESVMIKCNESLETWYLTCQDNRWIGNVGNCSHKTSPFTKDTDAWLTSGNVFPTLGIFLAVLLGIGLGIIIGMFLLLLVHCARRKSSPANKQVLQGLMSNIRKESDLDFESERATYGCVSLIEPQNVNNCFSMTSPGSRLPGSASQFDFSSSPSEMEDCLKSAPTAFNSKKESKTLRRQKHQQQHVRLPYSLVQYDECCPTCVAHCRERQCLIGDIDDLDFKVQGVEGQSNSSANTQSQQEQQHNNTTVNRNTLDRKSLYESMVYPLGLRTPEGLYAIHPNPQNNRQHQRTLPTSAESYCHGDVRIV